MSIHPPMPKFHWQNTTVRTLNARQLKWVRLCQSSRALGWMEAFINPHNEDKMPPQPWTNNQLIAFAANLMHEGKAETLRAILLLLLYDDLVELIDERRKK